MIPRHRQGEATSWQPVARWYSGLLRNRGSYFHEHVVIPGVLKLLNLTTDSHLLDLGCGEGILGRSIPGSVTYLGLDISPGLVNDAKRKDHNPNHVYKIADVTQPLPIKTANFTHGAIILALQNLEKPELTIQNTARCLLPSGKLVIVLNHPCFRIPRQSSWGIDSESKLQYRRINRYLSPLKIPITAHPGQTQSSVTWSFHYPLSTYSQFLRSAGFVIEKLEEWASDKESVGKASRMENRARSEIPLFLTILASLSKSPPKH